MNADLRIVPHQLAIERRTEYRVERIPGRKRRRRWTVAAHTADRPGCYVIGGVFYMHPDLVRKLHEEVDHE